MEQAPNYKDWSHESLIQRVTRLEEELKTRNSSFAQHTSRSLKNRRPERVFNPVNYSTRFIALKFAYLGKRYNGFEYHTNNLTPLPTIEEELWKALIKARLIFPPNAASGQPGYVDWEGCNYSKCGRTDKGVSAFGQVIGIRVRSNRPLKKRKFNETASVNGTAEPENTGPREGIVELASPALAPSFDEGREAGGLSINDEDYESDFLFDPVADEISYPTVLNRLLPPDIRILAWCSAPPLDFSARFSCRERHYKYFFTQPAFSPIPKHLESKHGPSKAGDKQDGWLNIEAMRNAARRFVGLQDFRNFCKVDASKQIINFERRIFHADIVAEDTVHTLSFVNGTHFIPGQEALGSEKPSVYPKVYSFTLHGSAFLWHQVRHMVAILFLVGQGLESPSIVSELLDVVKNPRRPLYDMASDTPLVLWNCVFPREDDGERKDALEWLYVGDEAGKGDSKYGTQGLVEDLWKMWRERKIDEVLAGTLIDVVTAQGADLNSLTATPRKGAKSQRVFDGGNKVRLQGTYIPVLKKPLMDSVATINERYAARKGFETAEDVKDQGFRRIKRPAGLTHDVD